jgi:hypothetical protein
MLGIELFIFVMLLSYGMKTKIYSGFVFLQ